eukprot:3100018-Amphidinium_carterae.3
MYRTCAAGLVLWWASVVIWQRPEACNVHEMHAHVKGIRQHARTHAHLPNSCTHFGLAVGDGRLAIRCPLLSRQPPSPRMSRKRLGTHVATEEAKE